MQMDFQPGNFEKYGELQIAADRYTVKPRTDLFSLLPDRKFGSVIEFGCADGTNLLFFGNKLGIDSKNLVGVDICRSTASRYEGFRFTHDSAENYLSTNDRTFDLVILSDVLEHLYNPWSILKSLRRFMHDASAMLLSVPNIENLRYMSSVMSGAFEYTDTGLFDQTHIRFFSSATLVSALQQNNFSVYSKGYRPDLGLQNIRKDVEQRLIQVDNVSLDMVNGAVLIDSDNIDRKFGQQILICAEKSNDK